MYACVYIQRGLRDRYFSTSASAIRVGSVGRRKGTRAGRQGQRRGSRRVSLPARRRRLRSPTGSRRVGGCRSLKFEERKRERERMKECFLAGRERERTSLVTRSAVEAFKDEDGDDNENKSRVQQPLSQ